MYDNRKRVILFFWVWIGCILNRVGGGGMGERRKNEKRREGRIPETMQGPAKTWLQKMERRGSSLSQPL